MTKQPRQAPIDNMPSCRCSMLWLAELLAHEPVPVLRPIGSLHFRACLLLASPSVPIGFRASVLLASPSVPASCWSGCTCPPTAGSCSLTSWPFFGPSTQSPSTLGSWHFGQLFFLAHAHHEATGALPIVRAFHLLPERSCRQGALSFSLEGLPSAALAAASEPETAGQVARHCFHQLGVP